MENELTNPQVYRDPDSALAVGSDVKKLASAAVKPPRPRKSKAELAPVKAESSPPLSNQEALELPVPTIQNGIERPGETAGDTEPSINVNMLTNADREWQAEITQTISDLKSLTQCEDFLATLEAATSDGDVDLFDRGLGVKSWIQGAVLTRIWPLPKKDEHGKPVSRPRILLPMRDDKRMTLGEYVHERLPFSFSTAHWVRKIFDVFTLDEARMGYREMLSQLAQSFRKTLSDGPPNTPNDADDVGDPDSDSSAAESGVTADTTDENGEGGEGKKTKIVPLAITQIPKKLDDIGDLIDRMAAVPESPDRYNNVSRHLSILADQQTRIENIKVKLAALPAALEQARQDINHWHEQGIRASQNKVVGKKDNSNYGEGDAK